MFEKIFVRLQWRVAGTRRSRNFPENFFLWEKHLIQAAPPRARALILVPSIPSLRTAHLRLAIGLHLTHPCASPEAMLVRGTGTSLPPLDDYLAIHCTFPPTGDAGTFILCMPNTRKSHRFRWLRGKDGKQNQSAVAISSASRARLEANSRWIWPMAMPIAAGSSQPNPREFSGRYCRAKLVMAPKSGF